MKKGKPNILLITSDQQRKDSLGCYNSRVKTPCLDRLAQDGVVYEREYITHPTCTPSRASILTGQPGSVHGAYTIGTALKEEVPMFSEKLSEEGYETFFIGKPHFQQLSTPGSMEYSGDGNKGEFWKQFHGPYYGFQHVSIYNGHTKYPATAGMHYRLWLKEKGLDDEDIAEIFNYTENSKYREHGTWSIKRELHPSVFTSEKAVEYLEQCDEDTPFAMWVSFSDPHDPHVVPAPYSEIYSSDEIDYLGYKEGEHDCRPDCYRQLYEEGVEGLPFADGIGVPSAPSAKLFGDDRYFREITAVHHGMVKLMDEEIGKIISRLKELGLYDNTLILFTTDHGDYLGNHGYVYKGFPAFEEVYNVPFIVKNVNQVNAGTRSDAILSHMDIAPSFLQAAGAAIPKEMWGIPQMDVFIGKKKALRESVLIENRPVRNGFYQKMIVTEQYKLVTYMDSPQGELYDLSHDRNQYDNLWDREVYKEVKRELLKEILQSYPCPSELGDLQETDKILHIIWEQMHSEEPVQERTSYS